jgi:hypothetical protein
MLNSFERLAHIQGVVAAAMVSPSGELLASVTNSPISREKLRFVGETCASIIESLELRQMPAGEGVAHLGEYSLVWRDWGGSALFLLLESDVNDAVLAWLWDSVRSLLNPSAS